MEVVASARLSATMSFPRREPQAHHYVFFFWSLYVYGTTMYVQPWMCNYAKWLSHPWDKEFQLYLELNKIDSIQLFLYRYARIFRFRAIDTTFSKIYNSRATDTVEWSETPNKSYVTSESYHGPEEGPLILASWGSEKPLPSILQPNPSPDVMRPKRPDGKSEVTAVYMRGGGA